MLCTKRSSKISILPCLDLHHEVLKHHLLLDLHQEILMNRLEVENEGVDSKVEVSVGANAEALHFLPLVNKKVRYDYQDVYVLRTSRTSGNGTMIQEMYMLVVHTRFSNTMVLGMNILLLSLADPMQSDCSKNTNFR